MRAEKFAGFEPKKCWVGDKNKICYDSKEYAEMSARLIEVEHGLPRGFLKVYSCEYGDHWHLAGG